MAGIPGFTPPGAYARPHPEYMAYSSLYPGARQGDPELPAREVTAEFAEAESQSEPEAELTRGEPRRLALPGTLPALPPGRLAVAGMLVVALVASTSVFVMMRGSGHGQVQSSTAQGLFKSPELADVAADNVIAAITAAQGARRLGALPDRGTVLVHVNQGFQKIDDNIRVQHPVMHRELQATKLSTAQTEAILDAMRHMRDPRVQRLGQGLLQSAGPGLVAQDVARLKLGILKHVQSTFRELRELRDELVPASLRHPDGQRSVDSLSRYDKMQMVRSFKAWYVANHPDAQQQAMAVRRRLDSVLDILGNYSIPGEFHYSKTPFTVQGEGYTATPFLNQTVSYVVDQAMAFFHQLGNYADYFGIQDQISRVFGGENMAQLKQCAVENLEQLNPIAETKCWSTWMGAAYDELMHANLSKSESYHVEKRLPQQPAADGLDWVHVASEGKDWWDSMVR